MNTSVRFCWVCKDTKLVDAMVHNTIGNGGDGGILNCTTAPHPQSLLGKISVSSLHGIDNRSTHPASVGPKSAQADSDQVSLDERTKLCNQEPCFVSLFLGAAKSLSTSPLFACVFFV